MASSDSTYQQIAQIADDRAAGWRLFAQLFAPPSTALVQQLRSGTWQKRLRVAIAWLNDSTEPFDQAMPVLDMVAHGAGFRQAADDLAVLQRAYEGPVGRATEFTDHFEQMAAFCSDEADAWETENTDEAKQLRVREAEYLEQHLVPTVPAWCVEMDEQTLSQEYRAAARLLAAWLTVESGRDFNSSLFPHPVFVTGGNDSGY